MMGLQLGIELRVINLGLGLRFRVRVSVGTLKPSLFEFSVLRFSLIGLYSTYQPLPLRYNA